MTVREQIRPMVEFCVGGTDAQVLDYWHMFVKPYYPGSYRPFFDEWKVLNGKRIRKAVGTLQRSAPRPKIKDVPDQMLLFPHEL